MENIIIMPETNQQSSMVKTFLKEMKVRFKVKEDDTNMTKEEFFKKIDEAKQEVRDGKTTLLTSELEKELFGSIL